MRDNNKLFEALAINILESQFQPGPFTEMYDGKDPWKDYLIFRVEAIHEYVDNPKYDVRYEDFYGVVSVKKEYENDKYLLSYPLIFTYAYKKDEKDSRALLLFSRNLMLLDTADQYRWNKFIENKNNYKYIRCFADKFVFLKPVTKISIYRAILLEIKTINEICVENGLEKMFKNEYLGREEDISEFRVMFLPTKRYYNHFILITNKIINESLKTFYNRIQKTHKPTFKTRRGEGKFVAFDNYLVDEINLKAPLILEQIIQPLKDLYDARNIAAHEVITDVWEEMLWLKQDCFLDQLYTALRELRKAMFRNFNSKVKIPECIQNGRNIFHP